MSLAPKRKPRKSQQEQSITISEFKQWLAGVEDMQEAGWVPDATQWAKIRAKVELLAETDVEPMVEQYAYPPAYSPSPYYTPPTTVAQDYSSLASQGHQYAPRAPSSSLLEGDGIIIPSPSQVDVHYDHPGLGPVHDTKGFA